MRHLEDDLQISCVRYFGLAFPKLAAFLHHSPNGGKRNVREAARFKKMGTKSGFADLFLMIPKNKFAGMFIELKSPKGKQTDNQKEFEANAKSAGYEYCVCRSFEEFQETINNYLN